MTSDDDIVLSAPDPIVGTTVLGRYRVVARLAAGGMGVVYLARAEGAAGFAKPMVVKRILPEHNTNANVARLFVREAKILANLQHPNIVGVTDFGEENGAYIMVLDYVRAYHLGLWLVYRRAQSWPFPIAGAIYIMCKVLDALDYAHTLKLPDGTELDVVHSDVSPSNVLVDTDGQVKLLDFGIARMRGEVTKSTDKATIRGKLAYLPLEALDGSPPGVKTDIYACGITLYELLAGTHPFAVDDDTVTIARVISHTPPPISSIRPDVPPGLDAILARGMAKLKDERFATAKEFARELRRVQPIPDNEAAATLAGLVRQDFAAMPDMPDLGAVSLAQLESAWRNPPPPSAAAAPPKNRAIEFAPTLAPDSADPPPQTDPRPARKKSSALPIAVTVAVVVAIGLVSTIVILVLKREPPEGPPVVIIEHGGSTKPNASTAPPAPPSAASSAPVAAALVEAGAKTKPPPQDPGDALSAAFKQGLPTIHACAKDQLADVDGVPQVEFRFVIQPTGAVQSVDLTPPEIAKLPVGQCMIAAAQRIKFPPQPGVTRFGIPVALRAHRP